MRYIELVEALSPDQLAQRSKLDQEIDDARRGFSDARERGDGRAAREHLTRFNNAVSALRDFDAQFEKPEPARPEGYAGEHEAPDHENGKPLFDVTGSYPADFYTGNARQYGDNHACLGTMLSYHKRPNAPITVYRAVPKTAPRKINPGDWVSISRRYAVEHGRDNLRNEYYIVSKTVFARDLFTDGNSVEEWGYDPQPRVRRVRPAP